MNGRFHIITIIILVDSDDIFMIDDDNFNDERMRRGKGMIMMMMMMETRWREKIIHWIQMNNIRYETMNILPNIIMVTIMIMIKVFAISFTILTEFESFF